MYSYLNGVVTEILPEGVTLEINEIGYFIRCANPYQFVLGEKKKVYIYQLVREDEISLYGFLEREKLVLFLKLISVKGLGPKMALPIFAKASSEEIVKAIENADLNFLIKFPKIGEKIAKQIILDLKGGLVKETGMNDQELIATLQSLGYSKKQINKILPEIDSQKSLEEKLKEALKLL